MHITGGSGALLVGGEAFSWRPWETATSPDGKKKLLNARGQFEVGDGAWGLFGVVWPKPGEFAVIFYLRGSRRLIF